MRQALPLVRNVSVQQTNSSRELLRALEEGEVIDVRNVLMNDSEALRGALTSTSMETEYGLRSPLMAAAASGNGAIYSTVHKAIGRACLVNKQGKEITPGAAQARFREEMLRQMSFRDKYGMTLAMLAVRSGSLVILRSVLQDMGDIEAYHLLTLEDHHHGQAVLAHAAASGNGAIVQAVLMCLESNFHELEVAEQLRRLGGNQRTLLMTAAASKNQMTFSACVQATVDYIHPSEINDVIKARDSDGMTFLMHACTHKNPFPDALSLEPSQRRRYYASGVRQDVYDPDEKVSKGAFTRTNSYPHLDARTAVTKEGLRLSSQRYTQDKRMESEHGIADRETKDAPRVHVSTGKLPSSRGRDGDLEVGANTNTQFEDAMLTAERDEGSEYIERHMSPRAELDPAVPVIKAAVAFLKTSLWSDEVRDQLKATDSWGRSVVTHAILSGSKQVFEVTFDCVRQEVLAEEVEVLMDRGNDEDETPTALAIRSGEKGLEAAVSRAVQNLKRDVDLRTRASTIEAKIQSFIPGKLVVIFQLLRPEVVKQAGNQAALYLLLVISFLAPVLSWASSLLNFGQKETGGESYKQRTSMVSYILSAPAMFVWGIGTSNIGQDTFGWEESLSAAVLAVGTIVIPAADAFGNSARLKQWKEQFSCARWNLERKKLAAWNKTRTKRLARVKRLREKMKRDAQSEEEQTGCPQDRADIPKRASSSAKVMTPIDEVKERKSGEEKRCEERKEQLPTRLEERDA